MKAFVVGARLFVFETSREGNETKTFVCPGYARYAPEVTSLMGRKIFLLNDDVDASALNSATRKVFLTARTEMKNQAESLASPPKPGGLRHYFAFR